MIYKMGVQEVEEWIKCIGEYFNVHTEDFSIRRYRMGPRGHAVLSFEPSVPSLGRS